MTKAKGNKAGGRCSAGGYTRLTIADHRFSLAELKSDLRDERRYYSADEKDLQKALERLDSEHFRNVARLKRQIEAVEARLEKAIAKKAARR